MSPAAAGWLLAAALAAGSPGAGVDAPQAALAAAEIGAVPAAVEIEGAEPAEVFVRANEAYASGDYRRAVELYERLAGGGHGTGHVWYNLGNALLRNGELGRAIAAYRRGLALLPRDENLAANLAFARRSARDALAAPSPSPILSTLFFWHWALSRAELAAIALALNVLVWGALALGRMRRIEALRWVALVLALPLAAVAGSLAVHVLAPSDVAVVVPQEIDAHNAPEPGSVVRFKLHAGTELEVRERRDGWLRIGLPDGQQGWIDARWAEVVG